MPAQPQNVVPIFIVGLLVWRVYARMRRNIGRQRLRRGRLIYSIVVYSLLTLFFIAIALLVAHSLGVLGGLAAGLAVGGGVGLYGLHLTRFESTPDGQFYTPHPYVGVGLTILLVGRVVYRMITLSGAPDHAQGQPQIFQSPLTLFIFGLLAGYYIVFFTGVLKRGGELNAPTPGPGA